MNGQAKLLVKFMSGADNRYIIPVYQRNYDWTQKQCKQLFDDLVQVSQTERKRHFFGSIVSTPASGGSGSDFLIIDGQQRLTTVSILLVAVSNLISAGKVACSDPMLVRYIRENFIVDVYASDERKLRLKPIKDDCRAFDKLVDGDEEEFERDSHVTQNYDYFCTRILAGEITPEKLVDAIKRLEIIDIFVEQDENPQLIFESLNSTGLDLTEADKIRNFMLMGLDAETQNEYYEKYWNKIERFTDYHVSDFLRHYLTLKQKRIPNINAVYFTFKEFVRKQGLSPDSYGSLLSEMLFYARIYGRIAFVGDFGWAVSRKITATLRRLSLIDVSVSYPFLLALFSAMEKGEISESEVEKSLECVESFVFRRILCALPTNALNKIFCTLDSDIRRLNKNGFPYSSVLVYVLESKSGSADFPSDKDFALAIREKNVYKMQKKNKQYLFDRLENKDSVERVNVVELMDSDDEKNRLTVEHVMPQTLSADWKRDLGENWKTIFETRLHTLPNLTLTGYNSKLSNERFLKKKEIEHGFRDSGLSINKIFLKFEKWTEAEMNERTNALVSEMTALWPYPKTDFVPPADSLDEVTLESADDLTGRKLVSFQYAAEPLQKTSQWVDMYTSVAKMIFYEDYAPMIAIASSKKMAEIAFNKDGDSSWFGLGQGIFLYKANSTVAKLRVLEKIFDAYGKDKSELVLSLQPEKPAES